MVRLYQLAGLVAHTFVFALEVVLWTSRYIFVALLQLYSRETAAPRETAACDYGPRVNPTTQTPIAYSAKC